MRLDARLPVRLVSPDGMPDPASEDAALIRIGLETDQKRQAPGSGVSGWATERSLPAAAVETHRTGCPCCGGRSGLADALTLLFAQRARMQVPFFSRVVLQMPPDRFHAALTILRNDALVSGRFRLEAEK